MMVQYLLCLLVPLATTIPPLALDPTQASLAALHSPAAGLEPAGTSSTASWQAQVEENLRTAEYAFQPVPGESGVWSAPNRPQELRSRFSPVGLEVFPRSSSTAGEATPWSTHLATKSFGRAGDVNEISTSRVTVDRQRAAIDHGPLVEWFVNTAQGAEQGWTIVARPDGRAPLWIGLEIKGDLQFRIEEGAHSALLVDANGDVQLCYRDLVASDATGKVLDARLRLGPAGPGIEVDDLRAVYPLSVDPVLTCPDWEAVGDQDGAGFGYSVSAAGDVNGDGYADVIVGAPDYDNGETREGRAFVYLGSGAGLSTTPAWTTESDQADTLFGNSVSTAGDVNGDGYSDVIIGAPHFSNGESREGRAYVYLGSASGLSTSPAWMAESDSVDAFFGDSVSTAGDVNGDGYSDVIIGAPTLENGEPEEGSASVYLGSGTGLSTSPAWTVESNVDMALFGWSVSTAGDVNGDGYRDVIVGARGFPTGGRAYVYLGSGTGLSASPAWMAEGNGLGTSVSTAGDVNGDGFSDIIVGAPAYENGQAGEGGAFVYLGSGTGLSTTPAWTTESDQALAYFGDCVSTAGDVNGDGYSDVIIGASTLTTLPSGVQQGGAYIYLGSSTGLLPTPAWTAKGDQSDEFLGRSVSTAGDVNGDGYDDVIIGSETYDDGLFHTGLAALYSGSADFASSTVFAGDGINADTIVPINTVIGWPWSAPLRIGHPHGTGGLLSLRVRRTTVNGPNFFSPVGGRVTEILIAGPLLSAITGSHNGVTGNIPPQPIPNQASLLGLSWAAQYTVIGGGYADFSQAALGVIIDSCPP